MKKADCRLIVFAKAPIPGEVKTRLLSSLRPKTASALHEQLVLSSLNKAIQSDVGPVELWCTPSMKHPFFIHCAEKFKVKLYQQAEGDIGMRMAHAFCETLKKTHCVLLIGTDAPSLTCADLKEAKTFLQKGFRAVIGPAEDGGYVLIGLRQYESTLFEGISWGTGSVLEETRGWLRRLEWNWNELPQKWDVDRPEDVERLKKSGLLNFEGNSLKCLNFSISS
jgi:rSAM/selenodomain-associated transferase 1